MSKVSFPQALHDFVKSNATKDHGFATVGPSLTRQEFAEECDINALMKRYENHVIGGPGNMAPMEAQYVDWTQQPASLLDYMNLMQEAETAFMSLPAVVRKEFDNSAMAFVDFASDPENLPQMVTWGLAPKPPEKAPDAVAAPPAPAPAPVQAAPGQASTHVST